MFSNEHVKSKLIFWFIRRALERGFDLVIYMAEDQNETLLPFEDLIKLYSISTLKCFEKCAYVSPSMLAMKNSDEIFDFEIDRFAMIEEDERLSIFLFKPSLDTFDELVAGWKDLNKIGKSS